MSLPQVVSRDRWLEARKELLAEEKRLTRARDALSARRRALSMVAVEHLDLTPLGRQDGIDDFKLHDTYSPGELAGRPA